MSTAKFIHQRLSDLINSTGDETRYLSATKDLWESTAEAWSSLYCRKSNLANASALIKAKNAFDLIKSDTLLDATHGLVEICA